MAKRISIILSLQYADVYECGVVGCRFRGMCARLALGAGGVCVWEAAGSLGRGGARALYRRALHALRASADDDNTALWLHFTDTDTIVSREIQYIIIAHQNTHKKKFQATFG